MLEMDPAHGMELIRKARQEHTEERLFTQWVVQLPYMDRESYVSFSEYKDRLTLKNVDLRPTDELMAELDEIEKQFEGADSNGS